MSAFGGKADIEWFCEEGPLLTHSGHCSQPSESVVLYAVGFLGTVAVLPPISAPHVIASQSDALRNLQVLSEEWLVDTL